MASHARSLVWMPHVLRRLYDRISSKVVSPTRAPPSDAVQKCREVAEVVRELEQAAAELDVEPADLEELRDILARPHVRVSGSGSFTFEGVVDSEVIPPKHAPESSLDRQSCGTLFCLESNLISCPRESGYHILRGARRALRHGACQVSEPSAAAVCAPDATALLALPQDTRSSLWARRPQADLSSS
ncbi:Peripheral plasma membrane protein CASK [Gryllus bimaculatus]|nr:Peripheral plasma membrane protein CASK [Gryllus bimaculatus]